MEQPRPSDLAERIVVRLPDGMRDRLAELAKLNNRSSNAEAVLALEHWLSRPDKATNAREAAHAMVDAFKLLTHEIAQQLNKGQSVYTIHSVIERMIEKQDGKDDDSHFHVHTDVIRELTSSQKKQVEE